LAYSSRRERERRRRWSTEGLVARRQVQVE
jgi:hypothetical protein